MDAQTNYYEVLGVTRDAGSGDIRRAYRAKALAWHPDNHPDDREHAHLRFKEIVDAYSVLSDPFQRLCHDHVIGKTAGRFSAQDIARMSSRPRRRSASPASAKAGDAVHPVRSAACGMALAVVAIAVSFVSASAALAAGVAALAMSSAALAGLGAAAMSLRAVKLTEMSKALALAAVALAGTTWLVDTVVEVADELARHANQPEQLQFGWPLLWGIRVVLAAIVFAAVSGRRAHLDAERLRHREYRFLLTALLVGVVFGLAMGQIAAALSWEYYSFHENLEEFIRAGRVPPAGAVHWVAAMVDLQYLWRLGMVFGLAVMVANAPTRARPQLDYAGLLKLILAPIAVGAVAAVAFGLAGAKDLLGMPPADMLSMGQFRPERYMAVWGVHFGAFIGILAGTGWAVAAVLKRRGRNARQVRISLLSKRQPLLTANRQSVRR